MSWLADLKYDPIKPLLASEHTAIIYWTNRDLLDEKVPKPQSVLWNLPIPTSILKRQTADGFWIYPSNNPRAKTDYNLLETYRQLGFLVEMFGFTKEHTGIAEAAEYIFSKQSDEGDIRGIYGNQYTQNYTAALIELLVKAGYEDDTRVTKAFSWLDGMQQDEGGWAIALRTQGKNLDAINEEETIPLDRSKPFSHLITGVVLRAYATHSQYRHSDTAKHASKLLAGRFFEKDVYPDKSRVADWTEFSYPFWMTDIVSSLNSIRLIDPKQNNEKIVQAKQWLIEHQEPYGLFTGHLLKDRYHDLQLWYSLAICRVLKGMSDSSE